LADAGAPPLAAPAADAAGRAVVRVKARRRTPWGQIVLAAFLLVVLFLVLRLLATNPNMRWDVVGHYLFESTVLQGVWTTIELTVISQALAIALGVALALLQQSSNPVAAAFANVYVWYFRAVPLLVQLIFFYNIALLVPSVGISIPFTDISWSANTNDLISGFTAAILGLGLHEAAYMSEIVRAGFLSVPRGQRDAGLSIGLTPGQVTRRIVLPQSVRVIIPPTGNQFIGLLKASALVSVIGGGDLLTRAEIIFGRNFLVIPLLIVATLWYIALVTVFSLLQHLLEVRLDPERNARGPSFGRRITRNAFSLRRNDSL
jgi:polar amino acid transport system permease protein